MRQRRGSRAGGAPRDEFSEAEIAAAWAERRYPAEALQDSLGRPLRVVFPGRRWGGPGPDFQGAVIALPDGTLLRGDVEVHRRASGWLAHGHAGDPAYQHVILHVVGEMDVAAPIVVQDGRPLLHVVLRPTRQEPLVSLPLVAPAPLPAHSPCLHSAPDLLPIIEAAGRERFHARAARFEGDLAVAEPSQVLWRGVAEALGYARNVDPFGRLAEAVPWDEAAWTAARHGAAGLSGLLLGTAGLLEQATADERRAWEHLQRTAGARRLLGTDAWEIGARVRPGNHPARRCRGLAHLAARWSAAPESASPAELACGVVRDATAQRWPTLWHVVCAEPWIGQGRARVVTINVLLPFAYASGLQEAEALYLRLPGEPPNRATRYMAEQLAAPGLRLRTACQQQGLLHLFKATCAQRQCEHCPAAAFPLAG